MITGLTGNSSSPIAMSQEIGTAIAKQGQKVEKMAAAELSTLLSSASNVTDDKGGSVDIKV